MNYIHKETKEYPLTSVDIISRHASTVSFPVPFEPLPEYALVEVTPKPEFNEDTHYVVEGEPEEKEEGYLTTWEVVAYTQEELDEIKAKKEAEEKAKNLIIVPRHKGLLALFRLKGIKESDINEVISKMEDPDEAYEATIYFNNIEWHNDSEWVTSLGDALNITDEELKELFEYAMTL